MEQREKPYADGSKIYRQLGYHSIWGTRLLKGLNEIEDTLGRRRDLYESVDLKIAALKVDGKWYIDRLSEESVPVFRSKSKILYKK